MHSGISIDVCPCFGHYYKYTPAQQRIPHVWFCNSTPSYVPPCTPARPCMMISGPYGGALEARGLLADVSSALRRRGDRQSPACRSPRPQSCQALLILAVLQELIARLALGWKQLAPHLRSARHPCIW